MSLLPCSQTKLADRWDNCHTLQRHRPWWLLDGHCANMIR